MENMEITKLKHYPCPFCGSLDVGVAYFHPLRGRLLTYAVCYSCGCEGPHSDKSFTEADVIKLWNCRFEFFLF